MTFFESLWRSLNTRDAKSYLRSDAGQQYPTLNRFFNTFAGQAQLWSQAESVFLDLMTTPGRKSFYAIMLAKYGGSIPSRYDYGNAYSEYKELEAFIERIKYLPSGSWRQESIADYLFKLGDEITKLGQALPSFNASEFLTRNIKNDPILMYYAGDHLSAIENKLPSKSSCHFLEFVQALKAAEQQKNAQEKIRKEQAAQQAAAVVAEQQKLLDEMAPHLQAIRQICRSAKHHSPQQALALAIQTLELANKRAF